MDAKRILRFLRAVAANNNREWFNANREEYLAVRADFENRIAQAIPRLAQIDEGVAHISVKDATYRFYRDTRFSADKSPYKRHLGAYIAAHGKKAHHGGFYIHLEPGHCLLACNDYCLPSDMLTACRNEIMGNIDRWLECVASERFVRYFGRPGEGTWDSSKGFGLESLKTCPSGFPRDYEHIAYLRMKDYCCWKAVPDTFFDGDRWLDEMMKVFEVAKPMMDFVNSVIDDYE